MITKEELCDYLKDSIFPMILQEYNWFKSLDKIEGYEIRVTSIEIGLNKSYINGQEFIAHRMPCNISNGIFLFCNIWEDFVCAYFINIKNKTCTAFLCCDDKK